jgi:histidine triad (HIT) family protein
MAASSASTKGWLLPVLTATFGFALTTEETSVALLGIVAVMAFAVIDANYLNQERAFRRLYDAVAAGSGVEPFSMNPALAAPATNGVAEEMRWWQRGCKVFRGWFPPLTVWSSWAIAPFYGVFFLVGLFIVIRTV